MTIEKSIEKPCKRHDWRLLSRKKTHDSEFIPQGDTGYDRAYGMIVLTRTGWQEVWYCTRCRRVEEVFVPR